ncbi:MAG: tRNA pseudouridine(55) synthase TruB [Muribaculaceae bacterium]|nr:tRNA pseudouridine(55) synthase TruB [Muribaculaceae bacterium]
MNFIEGEIIYIDKPLKWTSFDAVSRIRKVISRRLGIKKLKVGHAGTLDPLATGVMILCTGRATKRIEELQAGVKEYIATIRLGATTPSFDLETDVDATYPTDHITRELVEQVLNAFIGTIEQLPPAFSAKKVDGQRAYLRARKGQEVELKPKTLVIDEIELMDFSPQEITIRVLCGKGTYIRALARDIGLALNSGAHLTALRRTRVGDITVKDCLTIEKAVELLSCVPVEFPEDYPIPEKLKN